MRGSARAWAALLLGSAVAIASPATAFEDEVQIRAFQALYAAAQAQGLDPYLMAAIAYRESRVDPWALNVAGAGHFPESREAALALIAEHREAFDANRLDVGLMQINVHWAKRVSGAGPVAVEPADLLEPETNALFGALILSHELRATGGDVRRAVARYHTGPETDGNRERGERYADGVLRAYERFRARREELG